MDNFTSSSTGYTNMDNMFNRTNQFEQSLHTNKWKVQNLQDALTRYAPPNSCGCYHCILDDKEYEYEIYTDNNGRKSYKVYERIPCENLTEHGNDINEILKRLKALEEKLDVRSTPTSSTSDATL